MIKDATKNVFNKQKTLDDLKVWQQNGYTDVVLFGRFQPLHKGHIALLNTLRATDLNVNLVLNDKTDDIPGERNPFNSAQKKEMVRIALPWLEDKNVRDANVYLGKGGEVGDEVRKLTNVFNSLAEPGKLVFAYFEKDEDRKEYLVDGSLIRDVHYVELVGEPRGKFPILKITEDMISAVDNYQKIDAKMFRSGVMSDRESLAYGLLHPDVATYVEGQFLLAELNNRLVGASQKNDIYTLADIQKSEGNILSFSCQG